MREITLLKTALIFSLVGLAVLYFLSGSIKPIEYKPKEKFDIGDYVKAKGTVKKISVKKDLTIIEIAQQIPLEVVLFDKNSSLKEGDFIEVIGRTEEYKGNIEVIADKIRKIG